MDQEQEMRKAFEFAWLRALGAPDIALRNVLDGKRMMELAWQDFLSTRVESEPLRTGGPTKDCPECGSSPPLHYPACPSKRVTGGFADVSDFDENDPRSTI